MTCPYSFYQYYKAITDFCLFIHFYLKPFTGLKEDMNLNLKKKKKRQN